MTKAIWGGNHSPLFPSPLVPTGMSLSPSLLPAGKVRQKNVIFPSMSLMFLLCVMQRAHLLHDVNLFRTQVSVY